MGTTVGTTVLCTQYPARVAIDEGIYTVELRGGNPTSFFHYELMAAVSTARVADK